MRHIGLAGEPTTWRRSRHAPDCLGLRRDGGAESPPARRALVRYALAWLAAGGIGVALLVAVLDDTDRSVELPPVQGVDLVATARAAGCELRGPTGVRGLKPPVEGPRGGSPARGPCIYERPPPSEALTTALRRRVVVIHYAARLPGRDDVDELRNLQAAVPEGTIVTPNGTAMRYEVAVTAWRRLLGCPRFSPKALDAVQLFRGRFLGEGSDPGA
jgi:hypothetical protein